MDKIQILNGLKNERDRLDRAIVALAGTAGRRGRPPLGATERGTRRGGKRHMTAAGRKRLSEMMRKRWAKRKKQGRTRL